DVRRMSQGAARLKYPDLFEPKAVEEMQHKAPAPEEFQEGQETAPEEAAAEARKSAESAKRNQLRADAQAGVPIQPAPIGKVAIKDLKSGDMVKAYVKL